MNMQKTKLMQSLKHVTNSVLLKTGASKNTLLIKSYGEKKMSKVTMCDPPSGWRYGFPKPLPKDLPDGESVIPWLLSEGYPQKEIDNCGDYFYCRYWEVDEDEIES